MPRIEFAAENKVAKTNFDYPKLKLKSGERARVLVLEDPTVEFVHTLRAPQIVNGIPQMGTEKRKDGTEYQDYKKDFVSKPLCLGDFNTLVEKGSDPVNCSVCKMAQEHPDWVAAPQRRYAMHVVRYKTKAGGFDPITPFSVEVVVWGFTDTIFNQIVDFKNEWGDLRKHDLLLGPCTNEMFQKFEINVAANAQWLVDESRRALVSEAFKENQIPDLAIACGSKKEQRWLDLDLEKIRDAWGVVNSSSVTPGSVASAEPATDLADDLSSLLDTPAAPAAEAPAAEAPAAAEPKAEEPKAEEPKAETAPAGDFDDLLSGIDLS